MDVCLLLSVVCCQVEIPAMGSGVAECDGGFPTQRRPRLTKSCPDMGGGGRTTTLYSASETSSIVNLRVV
jgi:hypothetical protein